MLSNLSILGPLLGLSGVVVGWILNQLATQYLRRLDKLKRIRVCIYYLLETYLVLKTTPKIITNNNPQVTYLNISLEEGGEKLIRQVTLFSKLVANEMSINHIAASLEKLEPSYIESVEKIAELDPLLAISSNGILESFGKFKNILESIAKENIDKSPDFSDLSYLFKLERFLIIYQNLKSDSTIDNLKNCILDLASFLPIGEKNEIARFVLTRKQTEFQSDVENSLFSGTLKLLEDFIAKHKSDI